MAVELFLLLSLLDGVQFFELHLEVCSGFWLSLCVE